MSNKPIRLLIPVLVLCLLLPSVCLAETTPIDVSGYSDDEILSLSGQIQQEIVARGIAKTASLQAGQYTGGKELPAGAYILHCKTDIDHYGIVWVSAASDDPETDDPSILYEFVGMDAEESYYINIEEGGILSVPFPVELEISTGVIFK